ncbi:unnamed protein product [Didymodactylos carnosus]|uniref:NAD(P)(+)--arginine ADP-ribosyltransferase n=1 Tax=Didymodactylos carnosus TaxID=1234261 RepID=A0A814Y4D1_9BILA|nr:unnamed protein product [Didymodactylos carnosus]CAF3987431.1 unnamed protein product [Didymodactylos carnosus]
MAWKYQEDNLDEMRNLRYFDIEDEPRKMLLPIEGYELVPLMSLEMAVKPLEQLIPDIQRKVYVAKENSQEPQDSLSKDESGSIHLYTMEWEPHSQCLYFVLNTALRAENRQELKPFFPYLKLFLIALLKLPSEKRTVWRGVKLNLSEQYVKGNTVTWWGLSSCTESISVLESPQFLGKSGTRTLFNIECENGRIIRRHSYYPKENEILLLPATQFQIIDKIDIGSDTHIIHLREVETPFPFLQSPFDTTSTSATNSADITHKFNEIVINKASFISTNTNRSTMEKVLVAITKYPKEKWLKHEIEQHRADKDMILGGQNITDQDVEIIAEELMASNTCWYRLWLGNNKVTFTGVRNLSIALKINSTLVKLYLDWNELGDEGAILIAESLKTNKMLKVINLHWNKIGDHGCLELAEMLKVNQTLEELRLGHNLITDSGTNFISTALIKNNSLVVLDLHENQITDNCVKTFYEAMKTNRTLKQLDLTHQTCKRVDANATMNVAVRGKIQEMTSL